MNDGANGPILVPWALRKYQALYEDAKGLIMVATMVRVNYTRMIPRSLWCCYGRNDGDKWLRKV